MSVRIDFSTGITFMLVAGLLLTGFTAQSQAQSWRGDYPPFTDYGSEEALRIAENILSWQMDHGGWTKEVPFAELRWQEGWPKSTQIHRGVELGSFDDGKTTAEIRFLAHVYKATGDTRFRDAVFLGLDFIFAAQYPTGGWPQVYPERGNYSDYVTFNDRAMIRILELLSDVVARRHPFDFVDDGRVAKAEEAVQRGIDYIIRSQIEVDGKLTAWGQQHDPVTYEPRPGRSYEPAAITAYESVGIVEFLMTLPDPPPEVRRAILSALEWFEESRLPDGQWARFYEIGTNRPIFLGRDGIVRYSVTEIDEERQTGYAWFGTWPHDLLRRVHLTGYMDELHASLPDYPTPRILFGGVLGENNPTVSGVIPVDLSLSSHPSQALERIEIRVDDEVLYDGDKLPEDLILDTRMLPDGRHELRVTVYVPGVRPTTQRQPFTTENRWQIVEEMRPPDVSVWFGTVDYLHADARSDGWTYATGNAAAFFGDPNRLHRVQQTAEYLVWQAPQLQEARLTGFAKEAELFAETVRLAVSDDGERWERLAYETAVDGPSDAGWYRIEAVVTPPAEADIRWFRLEMAGAAPAEDVQIGRIVLVGFKGD